MANNGERQGKSVQVRHREPGSLLAWPQEIERRLSHVMRDPWLWPWRGLGRFPRVMWDERWLPDMDIFQRDGRMIVRADLPGMKPEDIEVAVEGDTLVIHGHRREEREISKEDYYFTERASGEFSRTIQLPEEAEVEAIEATCKNGVLEITIPCTESPKPKSIKVQVK